VRALLSGLSPNSADWQVPGLAIGLNLLVASIGTVLVDGYVFEVPARRHIRNAIVIHNNAILSNSSPVKKNSDK